MQPKTLQRIEDLEVKTNNHTSELAHNVQQITDLETNKADKTEVNSLATAKADKTYVDTNVSALDTKINSQASGSPKGAYATLTDLQNAFPTGNGNIYVVTADGKWYYWNGSAWVSGGIYQSTGIEKKSVDESKINDKLKNKLLLFKDKPFKNNITFASVYSNGILNADGNSIVLYYDVSKDNEVYINVHTYGYTDFYDLLDANGNIIDFKRNTSANPVSYEGFIDCTNASTLCISHRNSESTLNLGYPGYNIVKSYYSPLDNTVSSVPLDFSSKIDDCVHWSSPGEFRTVNGYSYIEYDVTNYDQVHIKANITVSGSEFVDFYVLYDADGNIIRKKPYGVGINIDTELYCKDIAKIGITIHKNSINTLSVEAVTNKMLKNIHEVKNRVNILDVYSKPWQGKKIVWFGTSIPAGGLNGLTSTLQYPKIVGEILGANVVNEAVGSSAVHCKIPSRISEVNPYGFNHGFDLSSRCLTNSLEEMEWIINNFNNTSVFDYNTVSYLSEDDKAFIRDCSWENKLMRHLGEGKRADLYVFNHGYNDNISDDQEAYYNAKTELIGTDSNGFYNNGTYVDGVVQSKRYDVTNVKAVVISGTFSQYYDFYDLFDSLGSNIRHLRNDAVNKTISITLDVSGATELVVSNNPANMATVKVEKLIYGMPDENLYCYRGAMDFLINKVKEDNPRARIVMIGEYENQKYPKIAKHQEIVSNDWNIPLYEQWNQLGWSQKKVKTTGYWSNGYWVNSGGTEQEITYLDLWLADKVHPHSDKSGKAINFMAQNIATWINNNIR